MEQNHYDVVIVGSGIAGAIVTKMLTRAGKRVLILEAGLDAGKALGKQAAGEIYQEYLDQFFTALAKVPNSPYPNPTDAQSPSVLDVQQIPPTGPVTSGYFVQAGPLPFASDYARVAGGTTMHWLGTCLRMLPNDFKLRTLYGRGVDWPIGYDDLRPYYEMAENEIGVSAAVDEQRYPNMGGDYFGENYVYPMHKIPQSYLDMKFKQGVERLRITLGGKEYQLDCISTPQGRNSSPNTEYRIAGTEWDKKSGRLVRVPMSPEDTYRPMGAIWDPDIGQRCEGNSSCVPICPVQAKYNALKTLNTSWKQNLTIVTQAVATQVEIDSDTGRVTGIQYKKYSDPNSGQFTLETATGTIFVLAANAIENAKLLLASGIANSSDQVGRNLMDHNVLLTWGLMPEKVYPLRGPGSTTNIAVFRDGDFRKNHAAWIMPVDNWGWNWPTFAPNSDVTTAVTSLNLIGKKLRSHLSTTIPRQLLLHFECEQLPESGNRVTIDTRYMDRLGNYRPVINYNVSTYTKEAFRSAKSVSDQVFAGIGVQDFTSYTPNQPDYVAYEGAGYTFRGAGHVVGTHRMGFSRRDSVVSREQRTWDHDNLFLVGAGNMSTLGTSNPTLTLAALAFSAAENILKDLHR